ncbi:YbaB/EbfC DNA-binding family protein [Asanoa ishikariensis]|uniref:YbaB/EbfC DNA-binding family protein n=1 Tax=Asanoa ishikariensis TaxID=137265 RepID=A0A1H3SE11_9ACTN|nr:YbaB/EbfC family nucleoid-associated protein [Asanoa ishikariensis]SDZ35339.1 YbaB/EbfC DNA-binding family protein [Asanoa ishikariensis]
MSAFDAIPKPMPAAELKDAVDALRQAVTAATATVSTPDGAVEVTAGPGNSIVGLGFGRAAYRYRPERLGTLVVDTAREATTQATGSMTEAVRTARHRRRELTDLPDLPDLLGGTLPEVPRPDPIKFDDGPSDGPADDDAQRADQVLRRVSEESQRQLAGYAQLRAELADLTATARSADGGVSAQVRAGGELLAVHIGSGQLQHDPATLASIVHTTVMTATARAAMLMADRVQQLTGPRLDIRSLVESYQTPNPDDDPHRS